MHIVCPHCDTVNRVELNDNAKEVKCGKCKKSLKETHPVELNARNFKIRIEKNDIPVVVDFCSCCGFLGAVVCPLFNDGTSI